ncbi:ymd8p [Saccharomyces arboricola H-6]|uniref:GDP-mannose transporter n=1 Tax=Saccharomyces arboricola (strain H-6 / AS 2.3317 / CBS 10644) TaxID=1160507 RepID=J8LK59_SACAR|nr:ymd8p [Saccharomyces arboricola H-6]
MNRTLFLTFLFGWYFCSIALSVYNRWMFDPKDGLGIEYPVLVTTFHQAVLWLLSGIYIRIRHKPMKNVLRRENSFNWSFFLKFLVPTAIASAGDIGLSNVSFQYVPLTIYTIIKSSSIAFVLLFGCIFKLERFHWKLALSVIIMFGGVALMVFNPNASSYTDNKQSLVIFGSLLVLASSCLSGLRWVYTQLLLRNNSMHKTVMTVAESDGTPFTENEDNADDDIAINSANIKGVENLRGIKPHPIHTIHQLAPIMGVSLLLTSLVVEKPFPGIFESTLFKFAVDSGSSDTETNVFSIAKGVFLLILPGFAVFLLTICEFSILEQTPVLTVSIAGIVKEVLTVIFGMIILSERLSGFYNWLGMIIIMADVCYYNYFRYEQDSKQKYQSGSVQDGDGDLKGFPDFEQLGSRKSGPYSIIVDSTNQEYELDMIAQNANRSSQQV